MNLYFVTVIGEQEPHKKTRFCQTRAVFAMDEQTALSRVRVDVLDTDTLAIEDFRPVFEDGFSFAVRSSTITNREALAMKGTPAKDIAV